MDNSKKKQLKKKEKSKDKNLIQKISNIESKLLTTLKQNWDKIEIEYDSLINKLEKFNEYLKEPEIKKDFKTLILLFSNFKNSFKNIFFNVGINIANLSNETSEKINNSYDNIYNEMNDLELVVKDLNIIQKNNKNYKKEKIQKLENKLHEFMDEVDNYDFDKIEKCYDIYKSHNQDDLEKILLQNDFIEKYNIKDIEYKNDIFEDNLLKINTLNHDSDNINIK